MSLGWIARRRPSLPYLTSRPHQMSFFDRLTSTGCSGLSMIFLEEEILQVCTIKAEHGNLRLRKRHDKRKALKLFHSLFSYIVSIMLCIRHVCVVASRTLHCIDGSDLGSIGINYDHDHILDFALSRRVLHTSNCIICFPLLTLTPIVSPLQL